MKIDDEFTLEKLFWTKMLVIVMLYSVLIFMR